MIDRFASISLLSGCLLFTVVLAAELTGNPVSETGLNPDPRPAVAAARPSAPIRPQLGPQLEPMIAEILARPLFSATRRPPPPSDNPGVGGTLSDNRLAGIVTEPGRRYAIFVPSGAKPLIVREGDSVSGWRIENISPREVSLSGPEGTKTLQPKNDPNLVPPPAPGTPASVVPRSPPVRPPPAVAAARPNFPPPFTRSMPLRPGLQRERR